ncbi:unnamed protein product, partial [Rotaria sp. Silwood2]
MFSSIIRSNFIDEQKCCECGSEQTNSSFITCISNTDISEAQPAGFDQTECDFKDSMINSFRFQEKSFSDDLKCYENLICEITEERVMEINRSPEISEDSKLIHARLMDNLKDFQLQNEKFKSTVEMLNKQKQEKEEEEEINQLRVDFNKEISRNKKLEKRLNAIERDYAQEKHFKEQLSQNQVNLKHDLEVKNAEIQELKNQITDLMIHLDGGQKLKQLEMGDELMTSQIV